jgi:hypothetical protein
MRRASTCEEEPPPMLGLHRCGVNETSAQFLPRRAEPTSHVSEQYTSMAYTIVMGLYEVLKPKIHCQTQPKPTMFRATSGYIYLLP